MRCKYSCYRASHPISDCTPRPRIWASERRKEQQRYDSFSVPLPPLSTRKQDTHTQSPQLSALIHAQTGGPAGGFAPSPFLTPAPTYAQTGSANAGRHRDKPPSFHTRLVHAQTGCAKVGWWTQPPFRSRWGAMSQVPQSRDAIQATQVLPSRLTTPCKYATPPRRLRTPRHHAVQVPAPPCRPTALAPSATPTLRLRTPRHHTMQVPPHYDATCVMAVPAATPTLLY